MPHELQRRDLTADESQIQVQTREDGKPVIVGYASVFYREGERGTEYEVWPGIRERIMPSAFDRAIREGHDVRGLVNHDPRLLLGRSKSGTLKITTDGKGLRYEIDPPDTTVAKDTITSLRRGDLSGSSFAFMPAKGGYEFREEDGYDVVEVRDVDLFDVGPVTFPAYTGATSGVREMRSSAMIEDYKAWKEGLQEQRIEEQKAKERMDKAKAKLEAMG
jgi:HK97 family phage prohead protease